MILNKLKPIFLEQALLYTHDKVAEGDFEPHLAPMAYDVGSAVANGAVKIVQLVKNDEPLVSIQL